MRSWVGWSWWRVGPITRLSKAPRSSSKLKRSWCKIQEDEIRAVGDETRRGGDVHVIKEYVHMILTRVHVIKTHVHVMCHVISKTVAVQRRFNCTVKMGGLSKQVPTVDCC